MATIDRKAIMERTLEQIRAKIPDSTIDKYKNYGGSADVKTLSTGSLAADLVLGGGFAQGRIINIVGHTSAGKTTLALTTCAKLQREKPDANILYVDAECALDPQYAKALGVNMDEIYLIQPDCGEDGYLAAEMFINSGVADLVIIDSLAAMIPKAMLNVELGEQAQIGMGARLDSQGISRLFRPAHKNGTTVILINQWKKAVRTTSMERTDGISGNYYQPGGETFKFYVSQMIEVQRVGKVYDGDELVSNQTRARVLKNKIAPPGREADFFITFGVGVDKVQEIVEMGIQSGDIVRSGRSLYSVSEETLKALGYESEEPQRFNGRNKFVDHLRSQPELCDKLEERIKSYFFKNKTDDIHLDEGTEVVKTAPMMD